MDDEAIVGRIALGDLVERAREKWGRLHPVRATVSRELAEAMGMVAVPGLLEIVDGLVGPEQGQADENPALYVEQDFVAEFGPDEEDRRFFQPPQDEQGQLGLRSSELPTTLAQAQEEVRAATAPTTLQRAATEGQRYKVTTVHGELETVYHVVDTQAPEGEQPAIVASYGTGHYSSQARSCACYCRDVHNGQGFKGVDNAK